MTQPYIICFAGGPRDGTAQEQEYLGATVEVFHRTAYRKYEKHTYIYSQIFELPDGRHVAVASHSGVQ